MLFIHVFHLCVRYPRLKAVSHIVELVLAPMVNQVLDHQMTSRQRLCQQFPFAKAFADHGTSVADHEVAKSFVCLPLDVDIHILKCPNVFIILLVDLTLNLNETVYGVDSVNLSIVQLIEVLDVAVFPPSYHGSSLHPKVHSGQYSTPIVFGFSLVIDKGAISIERAPHDSNVKFI